MFKAMIRHGDIHSHGGHVVASQTQASADSVRFVCEVDEAACHIHGSTRVASGTARMTIDGRRVACEGDLLACGGVLRSKTSRACSAE